MDRIFDIRPLSAEKSTDDRRNSTSTQESSISNRSTLVRKKLSKESTKLPPLGRKYKSSFTVDITNDSESILVKEVDFDTSISFQIYEGGRIDLHEVIRQFKKDNQVDKYVVYEIISRSGSRHGHP